MNYCSKCGARVEQGAKFCRKCGILLESAKLEQVEGNNQLVHNNSNNTLNGALQKRSEFLTDNTKGIFIGVGIGLGVLLLFFVISLIIKSPGDKYYFDSHSRDPATGEVTTGVSSTSSVKKGKYSTAIIYDNVYLGVSINNQADAYQLIEKDSVSQKNNCPAEIKVIEDDFIKKYGITAVNLCEMNVDFAKEIGNVIKKIYEEYPGARGYITNLSLANVSMSNNYIAAFMPVFNFAKSDSASTYPWVIKTQVLLNTSYFLNKDRLQSAVTDSSNSGHFPPNATIYSPVAHEFGHYLSFLAMMKSYDLESILLVDGDNINRFYDVYSDFVEGTFSLAMITEAYNNYKRDTNTSMLIDEWRGTISAYALAKDNSGEYIYDETIAEAFHDVYLNGDNAKDASKYIVQVLKSKLGS